MQKVVTTAVFVAVFVILFGEVHAVERLVGRHAQVVHPAGADAFDGHLDVGRHAGGRFQFGARDETDVAIITDGVSFAKIDDRSGCHRAAEIDRF